MYTVRMKTSHISCSFSHQPTSALSFTPSHAPLTTHSFVRLCSSSHSSFIYRNDAGRGNLYESDERQFSYTPPVFYYFTCSSDMHERFNRSPRRAGASALTSPARPGTIDTKESTGVWCTEQSRSCRAFSSVQCRYSAEQAQSVVIPCRSET